MKATHQTSADIAREQRNAARLDEVNGFLKGINLALWQVDSVAGFNGYILGVYMTLKPTGEAILAQSAEDIATAEREYLATAESEA